MVQFEGQNFPGGAKQFRLTFHKYLLVTGHTFKFLKNDDYRESVSVHTCSGGLIDITKPNLSKKVVKELIPSDVKDNPSVQPSLALRAKGLALREIYGKEESSYMELLWYIDALRRTNLGSHIMLEVDPATKNVFPNAHHGYCFWHLRNNLKKMIPVKSKLRPYFVWLLETCAYATTEKKFEDAYACLRSKGGKKVRKFLDAIPLEC
ncbi:hypothetical protein BVC80_9021g44 [Macleaya cordata]|uniref:MULE transposase domain-containing protein n=1 Tax=Macleaya cordata TaxID=56857 RepID=A0A200QV13_MACCD|nr:hypothetical protein BVC80_9021g44 [Macleaya cordata]